MQSASSPLPQITPLNRPYWEHARKHRLHLQQCGDCRRFRFPEAFLCAECGGRAFSWQPVSGNGEVVSWVIFHRCYFPAFMTAIPYNVAIVRLDEDVLMIGNIVAPNDSLAPGLRVGVVFEDVTPEISIPKFKPLNAG